jgi:hypothetical protein
MEELYINIDILQYIINILVRTFVSLLSSFLAAVSEFRKDI